MSLPPWHMWGNTQRVELVLPAGSTSSDIGHSQTARVPFMRPDSFHWFFFAQLVDVTPADAGQRLTASVSFDLSIGIGRAQQTINDFENYTMLWDDTFNPSGVKCFSSESVGPNRFQSFVTGVASTGPSVVSEIVAQDIQLQLRTRYAVVQGAASVAERTGAFLVSAFFAPKNHVRAEWYEKIGRFKGGEDKAL